MINCNDLFAVSVSSVLDANAACIVLYLPALASVANSQSCPRDAVAASVVGDTALSAIFRDRSADNTAVILVTL